MYRIEASAPHLPDARKGFRGQATQWMIVRLQHEHTASFCLGSAAGGGVRSVSSAVLEKRVVAERTADSCGLSQTHFRNFVAFHPCSRTWLQAVPPGWTSTRAINCFGSSPSMRARALDQSQSRAWRTSFARTGFSSTFGHQALAECAGRALTGAGAVGRGRERDRCRKRKHPADNCPAAELYGRSRGERRLLLFPCKEGRARWGCSLSQFAFFVACCDEPGGAPERDENRQWLQIFESVPESPMNVPISTPS